MVSDEQRRITEFEQKGASTDLYRILNGLQQEYRIAPGEQEDVTSEEIIPGLNNEEIGLIYAISVLKHIPGRFWLSNMDGQIDQLREAKRFYQEKTRIRLYQALHELNPDLNTISRSERLEEYRLEKSGLVAIPVVRSSSIEYVVHALLTKSGPFERIGDAVIKGSQSYVQEKPAEVGYTKYKIFLEYQRIQRELEKKLEL